MFPITEIDYKQYLLLKRSKINYYEQKMLLITEKMLITKVLITGIYCIVQQTNLTITNHKELFFNTMQNYSQDETENPPFGIGGSP